MKDPLVRCRRVLSFAICMLLTWAAAAAQNPFRIATVAGTAYDPSGDGGPATLAANSMGGAAFRDENLYLTDGARVRKISPDGTITTVVGLLDPVIHQPVPGFSGDGGPALGAQLRGAFPLEFDTAGNLYIGDAGNSVVRKVTARVVGGVPQPLDGTEIITTIAGIPLSVGNSGDGGPATSAKLNVPRSLAFDPSSGALYIGDSNNNNVRKLVGGIISTVAGTGVAGFSGDGGPAVSAMLNFPLGVTVDPATGNVYVSDVLNNRLRKISGGIITTAAGTGTISAAGGLNEGGAATAANVTPAKAKFVNGILHIMDSGVGMIRKVDATGIITTVAGIGLVSYSGPFPPVGDGGLAIAASFGSGPSGIQDIAFDSSSNLFVTDVSSRRVRFLANVATTIFGQAVSAGSVATVVGPPGVTTFNGDGGAATAARLFAPGGITTDPVGNIYVADANNNRVREISTARMISTVAGTGVAGYSGVPGVATAAKLQPGNLAFDFGSLYLTNNLTRVLKVSGTSISLVANTTGTPSPGSADGTPASQAQLGAASVAFDASGNLYIGDNLNFRIWKVDMTGKVQHVVGGGTVILDDVTVTSASATQVRLFGPGFIAFDPSGNLYTVDGSRNRILKVTAHGVNQPLDGTETVTIFAGTSTFGYSGDGGPATAAALNLPGGLVFDAAGNLYFNDGTNFRVRKVDSSGIITTVAGNGSASYSGDGGLATSAQIRGGPLAFDSFGNLFMSDSTNNVVRVLDNTPPAVSGMPGSGCSLWPPNGKMVHVATLTAADTGAGISPGSFTVTGTSNEPPSSSEIAITPNGAGGYDVSLRADRLGSGSGRVYTLTATASDRAGNVATVSATCTVPHDQGH